MATHSSILAWKFAWTEEPGVLQSIGSQRVGHDLATEQQLHETYFFWIHALTMYLILESCSIFVFGWDKVSSLPVLTYDAYS